MKISRRKAIQVSGTALTGLSLGLRPEQLLARAPQGRGQTLDPDKLVETDPRTVSDLSLLPDGSAPERSPNDLEDISGTIWRYTRGQPPEIDFDYRNLKVKVDARGTATRTGTMTFADLEPLPRRSHIFLLQCGNPTPRGIVKWTGVRFSDVAQMLGIQPFAYYCRFVGSDTYWVEEDMKTLMHPQVLLAWMINDAPIPPEHGAPLRLVIPFRYGARSVKAVTDIILTATSFGLPTLPPGRA
jgi:DMSO/TMAO reductase YedYZ molybdopterin-dependent catalytic subunit